MERPPATMLRIGAWCVNPSSGQISRDGETARLEARTMRCCFRSPSTPARSSASMTCSTRSGPGSPSLRTPSTRLWRRSAVCWAMTPSSPLTSRQSRGLGIGWWRRSVLGRTSPSPRRALRRLRMANIFLRPLMRGRRGAFGRARRCVSVPREGREQQSLSLAGDCSAAIEIYRCATVSRSDR
jgi:hypothetical protein